MAHDYIPRRDTAFRAWASNFSAKISDTPEAFGLTPQQAAAYAALNEAYATALKAASDPGTRTKVTVSEKKTARRAAEREARRLAQLIQATANVTSAQKRGLGLTVRDTKPTPVGRPAKPPSLFVKLRFGSTIRVTLRGRETTRRGKPQGVAGAMVFSYLGDNPPADLSDWTFAASTTRPRIDLTLTGSDIVPGAKVWITAQWYNARAQCGPAAQPKSMYIQCPTLWFQKDSLRQAA